MIQETQFYVEDRLTYVKTLTITVQSNKDEMNIYSGIRAEFVLKPIISLSGHLMGGEILTRFLKGKTYLTENDCPFSKITVHKKDDVLREQIEIVSELERSNKNADLLFTINIDHDQIFLIINSNELKCKISSLNSIRLELSELILFEDRCTLSMLRMLSASAILWLDNFGSGHASSANLKTGLFECVKIEKDLFLSNFIDSADHSDLKMLSDFSEKIIVEGVSNYKDIELLSQISIAGMQGWIWKTVKLHTGFFRSLNFILDLKRIKENLD